MKTNTLASDNEIEVSDQDSVRAETLTAAAFSGQVIDIHHGQRQIKISANLSVQWKLPEVLAGPNGVNVQRATVDGIDCLEITTPAQVGWVRFILSAGLLDQGPLLAARAIIKVQSDMMQGAVKLRSILSKSNVNTDRTKAYGNSLTDLACHLDTWYEVRGLWICDAAEKGACADWFIDLPVSSRILIACADTNWFAVTPKQQSHTTGETRATAVVPTSADPLDLKDTMESLAGPAVFAYSINISGFDVTGWILAANDVTEIEIGSEAETLLIPIEREVSLKSDLNILKGVKGDVTSLLSGGGVKSLTCRVSGGGLSRLLRPLSVSATLSAENGHAHEASSTPSETVATTTKLFFFPDYTETNPYQKLMYGNMSETTSQAGGIDDAIAYMQNRTGSEPVVMHLHWLHPILGGASRESEAEAKRRTFIERLSYFVHIGGIVFWTIHNVVSHDAKFAKTERLLGQQVADLALRIHLHSRTLLPILSDYYLIDESKLLVEPHPNYISHYANYVSAEAARLRLSLPLDAKVFLFFGQLRPYKGIEALVNSFCAMHGADRNAYLLIVGNPVHPYKKRMLQRKYSGFANIRVIEGHVSDNSLQWYYNAADWVVLPYQNILTSGSLLCALSFSRPVIAPALGMIPDLLEDGTNGLSYDPSVPNGLTQTLKKAMDLPEETLNLINLHSPGGVSFEVKIACIRSLDKDFLPQAAPAVAQTAGSGRIRPRSRCFLAQGRRFSAQRTDLSSRFRSV